MNIENISNNQEASFNPMNANQRIVNARGHAIGLVEALRDQNSSGKEATIKDIYDKAINEIEALYIKIETTYANRDLKLENQIEGKKKPVSEVTQLKIELKKAQSETATIIQQANAEARIKRAILIEPSANENHLKKLANGGIKALWIRFLALLTNRNANAAVAGFKSAEKAIQNDFLKDIASAPQESKITKDRRAEFDYAGIKKNALKKRHGVISLDGTYRVKVSYSKKEISKQLTSYMQQSISDKERLPLTKTFDIKNTSLTATQLPLNSHFDKELGKRNVETTYFKDIFDDKGISSANRHESHLINAYQTSLKDNNNTLFKGFRHAVISDVFETSEKLRNEIHKQMAMELVTAALLESLADSNLSLEDAAASKKPLNLTMSSVGLLTPDIIRQFGAKDQYEKRMLDHQMKILKELDKTESITINGHEIKVNLKVFAFNFGVNAGAVSWLRLGTGKQHKYNKSAVRGLLQVVKDVKTNAIEAIDKNNIPRVQFLEKGINDLVADIELLTNGKNTYLSGSNQYEVGAKILLLTHLTDELTLLVNANSDKKIDFHMKGAFNCKSGKDRTGYMNAVAFTFAKMAEINGSFPTHKQLETSMKLRSQFREILQEMLVKSGGLEITQINADGAMGYKVGKEALIYNMKNELKLLQMEIQTLKRQINKAKEGVRAEDILSKEAIAKYTEAHKDDDIQIVNPTVREVLNYQLVQKQILYDNALKAHNKYIANFKTTQGLSKAAKS